ncbi:putative oxidoreductase [Brevibacterium sandarakinum]|uniref:Oxidoreductase n=1 Tax=Brevibacterium sandarakinum TaxID=629680 RepID=A0A1H1P0R7_BRESA|nr:DoxX family protein [Brevibacterium sandarakinum]SDS04784.1 putative oxidoreductase [Brevibacterium sandarakinum]
MGDIGLLMIRLVVGLLLAGHGTQKLFGWFGGAGPAETGRQFAAMGYRSGRAMAVLAGLSELGAGCALAVGVATPLATAAVVGVMVNAAVAAHGKNGLWADNGGYEYALVIGVVAVGIATHGPGDFSVDALVGMTKTGWAWGLGVAVLGAASATIVLLSRQSEETNSDPTRSHDEPRAE